MRTLSCGLFEALSVASTCFVCCFVYWDAGGPYFAASVWLLGATAALVWGYGLQLACRSDRALWSGRGASVRRLCVAIPGVGWLALLPDAEVSQLAAATHALPQAMLNASYMLERSDAPVWCIVALAVHATALLSRAEAVGEPAWRRAPARGAATRAAVIRRFYFAPAAALDAIQFVPLLLERFYYESISTNDMMMYGAVSAAFRVVLMMLRSAAPLPAAHPCCELFENDVWGLGADRQACFGVMARARAIILPLVPAAAHTASPLLYLDGAFSARDIDSVRPRLRWNAGIVAAYIVGAYGTVAMVATRGTACGLYTQVVLLAIAALAAWVVVLWPLTMRGCDRRAARLVIECAAAPGANCAGLEPDFYRRIVGNDAGGHRPSFGPPGEGDDFGMSAERNQDTSFMPSGIIDESVSPPRPVRGQQRRPYEYSPHRAKQLSSVNAKTPSFSDTKELPRGVSEG